MAENGSHSRTGNKEITLSVCHSHTCCCGGMLRLDLRHPPKNAYSVFSDWQRWKNPDNQRYSALSEQSMFVFGVSSTNLKLCLFFFLRCQTIHSNNKKQITTWFILTIAVTGTKRGTKRKKFKMNRRRSGSKNSILFPCPPSLLLPLVPTATLQSGGRRKKKKKKRLGVWGGEIQGKNSQITIGNFQNRLFSLVVFIPFVFSFSFSLLSPFFI